MTFPRIVLVFAFAGIGCSPQVHFVGQEPVTAQNADRLAEAFSLVFARDDPFVVNPSYYVSNAITDGDSHLFYLHRHAPGGGDGPVGIETYDLKTGKLVRVTRIPTAIDMQGQAVRSTFPSFLDIHNKAAFVNRVFSEKVSENPTDYGNRVIRLDLLNDAPRVIAPDDEAGVYPRISDDRHVLLVKFLSRKKPIRDEILYVNRKDGTITARVPFPEGFSLQGGAGDFLVGSSDLDQQERNGHGTIGVWRREGNKLAEVGKIKLPAGWSAATVIDWKRMRIITAEGPKPETFEPFKKSIRVYEIPTLRRIPNIDIDIGECQAGFQMEWLHHAPLLWVAKDPETMLLLDLETGKELRRFKGLGKPVIDPHGRYVGGYTRTQLRLFAIAPK